MRVRLGKTVDELGPGIHFRLPFLDRIYVRSSRLRYTAYSGHTVSSKDKKIFNISIAIRYKLKSMTKLYLALADPETTLYLSAIAAIADYVCVTMADDVTPAEVMRAADASVQTLGHGLEDLKVSVVDFAEMRCYRLITGDSWVPTNLSDLDDKEKSGER